MTSCCTTWAQVPAELVSPDPQHESAAAPGGPSISRSPRCSTRWTNTIFAVLGHVACRPGCMTRRVDRSITTPRCCFGRGAVPGLRGEFLPLRLLAPPSRRGHNRIGARPMLFEIERAEASDIDEELDFAIAEYLFRAARGPMTRGPHHLPADAPPCSTSTEPDSPQSGSTQTPPMSSSSSSEDEARRDHRSLRRSDRRRRPATRLESSSTRRDSGSCPSGASASTTSTSRPRRHAASASRTHRAPSATRWRT